MRELIPPPSYLEKASQDYAIDSISLENLSQFDSSTISWAKDKLRAAFRAGYDQSMRDLIKTQGADRIESLKAELSQLGDQRKEADLNYTIAKSRIISIEKQIDFLHETLEAIKNGQLPIDIRPDPEM